MSSLSVPRVRHYLHNFELEKLFVEELGWDRHRSSLEVAVAAQKYTLRTIAEKRKVYIFRCEPGDDGKIPDYNTRRKIEKQVAKSAYEHLIIFVDGDSTTQIWQWVARQPGQPAAYREHPYYPQSQSGEALVQKLARISIPLDEEEALDLTGVVHKLRDALNRDQVTKRFYDRFKKEHGAFLAFIKGITEKGDREWYASLMLNRLMFVYFIEKQGFLDGHRDYLRDRLNKVRLRKGRGKFLTFYCYFLLKLFHEGFAKQPEHRELDPELTELLGNVPYLDGGLFDVHELEQTYREVDIPDEAFEKLFDFFEQYDWHLDNRPLRTGKEINPDVLGYIFEKYINQKQMGAYYTKEDITDYISKNTIIPYLFDAARKECAVAFRPKSAVWQLLRDDPDAYIYPAVRRGVIDEHGEVIPLPEEIAAGVDDVSQRGGWNRAADAPYALPTETWREHVARRERCLEIREKLLAGEVHEVNDLITYNLNVRQFALDVVTSCEGPDLLRALWHAIRGVSVLDPACGSGAFLFAALNILQPLYDACLERMQAFVEDLDRSGEAHSPKRFSDFRAVLRDVSRHPNRDYFVLKSIIVANLYGVDIMEEAVEICKLRLFLKLVAQVDKIDHLEPLPDIDFNIRPGNTLVGFARLEHVKMSLIGTFGFDEAEVNAVVEDAEIVDRAFRKFHEMQVECEMDARHFAGQKQILRDSLNSLVGGLDRFIARDHGIGPASTKKLDEWRVAYHPFHWFAEFYGIMRQGGFAVVIGNPPYVELRAVKEYKANGYACESAGNLYALFLERSAELVSTDGRQGFIVPVSSVSTDRYEPLQRLLRGRALWYSSFDDRPSRLFDGLEHIRLTIHLIGTPGAQLNAFSTRYNKWNATERLELFDRLMLTPSRCQVITHSLPKLCVQQEARILRQLANQRSSLAEFYSRYGAHCIFYSRKVGYFLQVLDFEPMVLDGHGQRRPPSEFKTIRFACETHAKLALCCLNSNLFYWFITVFSDCRHVNKREVDAFPVNLDALASSVEGRRLMGLGDRLMRDLSDNSETRVMKFKHDTLTVQCIIPKLSKPIIDDIDRALGTYYGLPPDELDFIVNYDAKYRLGIEEVDE